MRDVLKQMRQLKKAAIELEEVIARDDVVLAKFGHEKILMVCGKCDGAFTADIHGIHCRNCGQKIKIQWPKGITPTPELLRRLLREGFDLFNDGDLSDAA